MKHLITFAALLISTSALAEPCGINCVTLKLNDDLYNDKVEFVVGKINEEQNDNVIHALNLKVSITKKKTYIKAHDHVEGYPLVAEYTTVTDQAYILKQWTLSIDEKTKIATVKWYLDDNDGSLISAKYQIHANGSATLLK